MSIQEFSRYTTSEIWVYLCALKVREFIEKVLEFDIGRSWNLRCQNVYEPCIRRVFHLSLRLITAEGRSAHLAHPVHKSGHKTATHTHRAVLVLIVK